MIERVKRTRWEHLSADVFLMILSGYVSFFAVLGQAEFINHFRFISSWILLSVILRSMMFSLLGVYDSIWRYISLRDAAVLVRAIVISSVVLFTIYTSFGGLNWTSPAYFLINMLQLMVLLGGARVLRRIIYEKNAFPTSTGVTRPTLIYGAGLNGRGLANRLEVEDSVQCQVVGFIDDDKKKIGHSINGIKVLGSRSDIPRIIDQCGIKEVIVAIPGISGEALRQVMELVRPYNIRPRLLSDISLTDAGKGRVELVREVDLDDLLNRPMAEINLDAIREYCRGKRVLITGAGGSIGSEIARQVLWFGPSKLLLLDNSEFNLYSIDQELCGGSNDRSVVIPLLVDLKDRKVLETVMELHRPQVIFHAAAYKHVHLVEANPGSAILNNIGGARNLLEVSQKIGVDVFVQISTDKAVNPVGAMGATKRVCELLVSRVGDQTGKLYCTVRFGNVVGSSGSLIPLLKKQIRAGGPITLTHESMTRYFMLIKEAVSLVLKSSSIAKPGDICILRMGDPIRIVDIAKNLIMLLGRKTEEIPILFIGSRPGEKLHEELYLTGEEITTEHPDILLLPKRSQQFQTSLPGDRRLEDAVDELLGMAEKNATSDTELMRSLMLIARPLGSTAQALTTGATGTSPTTSAGTVVSIIR